ncbi:MAG: glycosyltransferase family 4 protein [Candidatus Promineifilaceae bacterium]
MMIAPTSFFNDYGGHIRILEETLALQALGQQVTIVTYFKGNDVPGLDIRRTAALPYHTDYDVGSSRHKLAFDTYLAAKALKVALQVRPDLIHGHMHEGALIGGMLAGLLRVPLVFDYQGGLSSEMVDHGFLNPSGPFYPMVRRLERFICHLPNATLTSSHRARAHLANHFGVSETSIYPLPDCVDTGRFNPERYDDAAKAALRLRLGISSGRPILVYLGLLADYQGTPDLVEAAALLKERGEQVHFLIMGYPRVDEYRFLAKQKGVDDMVTFTGKVAYDNAPLYLSLGDIAVSAKMSATEGSGKVLNYMAMGQPVVAYDTPVHQEYLGDLGVFAPIGDIAGLADAISGLLHDPQRGKDMGRKLRLRAETQYSWQRASRQIADIYNRLTG